MSKTIRFYIDDELEALINTILKVSDDFESENALLRICVKKYLKQEYREELLKSFENEE